MKDLIVFRCTHLHKKLTLLILALNSFWLARNRLHYFGPCEDQLVKIVPIGSRASISVSSGCSRCDFGAYFGSN